MTAESTAGDNDQGESVVAGQIEYPELSYQGRKMDTSSACFGALRPSADAAGDRAELWRRMEEDGYLYLPGRLDREEVMEARREVMARLAAAGVLDERHPPMDGVFKAGSELTGFHPRLAQDNPALDKVLYAGSMMAFYEFFLGAPVRHFDYTWFRVKKPGPASPTVPHYDIVYMGRGTPRLYTSWTPLGDVPFEMGGLMLLENSHRLETLKGTYGQTDVDLYCENEGNAGEIVRRARRQRRPLSAEEGESIRWNSPGAYSEDAAATREDLGGRWLTAEFRAGDLLVFGMFTMHASSDNRTDRIRISSDSRYQLASEEVDERWIGSDPPAHGIRAKRGMIC